MSSRERGSILRSLLGIVACGGLGGVAAWGVVTLVGLRGTFGAIVAAVIGMIVATGLWAGAVWLLQRWQRPP